MAVRYFFQFSETFGGYNHEFTGVALSFSKKCVFLVQFDLGSTSAMNSGYGRSNFFSFPSPLIKRSLFSLFFALLNSLSFQ